MGLFYIISKVRYVKIVILQKLSSGLQDFPMHTLFSSYWKKRNVKTGGVYGIDNSCIGKGVGDGKQCIRITARELLHIDETSIPPLILTSFTKPSELFNLSTLFSYIKQEFKSLHKEERVDVCNSLNTMFSPYQLYIVVAAIITEAKFLIVPKKKPLLQSCLKHRMKGMSASQSFLTNYFLMIKISQLDSSWGH